MRVTPAFASDSQGSMGSTNGRANSTAQHGCDGQAEEGGCSSAQTARLSAPPCACQVRRIGVDTTQRLD